ncbi:MAG: sigma-54-dependent transcriptional regulator [bacterium]|jgi:DNA-binding NtrC family response regulator
MTPKRVLIIDDDASLLGAMRAQLEQAGWEVLTADCAEAGLKVMDAFGAPIVITDLRMPGMSGIELLRELRSAYPETTVVLMTGYGTVQTAVEAMRAGAYDVITKPIDYDALLLVLDSAIERHSLLNRVQSVRASLDEKFGFEEIIGKAKPLLRVLKMAGRAARTDSVVLISGETGTGKELLAAAIHRNSRRKARPFVVINCGAIPKALLESELFGYTKGAFTGASSDKRGRVETADGGTLFLDEIGELPLELQVKLLRLIRQGEIEKLGSEVPVRVNVRIIAATNRNLQAMVQRGEFREDLYYRLAVIPLELPPLRERVEDIPELAQHFLSRLKVTHNRPGLRLPASLMPYFVGYEWPGNVRELENVIERLVVLTPGDEITLEDLPECLRKKKADLNTLRFELPADRLSLEEVEKDLIIRALKKFSWNQTQAAQYLDISRRTLIYRMEKFGLRKE